MNYTSSSRLFTHGQKDRGVAMFLANRSGLTTSLGGTPPPATSPTLVAASCVPNVTNTTVGDFQFGPTLVKIGTINNASEGSNTTNSNKTYYDYSVLVCSNTKYSTDLVVSQNPQTITLACKTNTNTFNVYTDYDNNGAFDESTEKVVTEFSVAGNTQSNATFTIPSTGVTLDTPLRMRVVGGDDNYASCANNITYGQVEDYMVTIKSSPTLAVINSTKSNSISIYPNPAKDGVFSIKFANTTAKDVKVAIVDMTGRVVYQTAGTTNNNILNVNSKLTKGNYIVKVISGSSTTSEKLIIK